MIQVRGLYRGWGNFSLRGIDFSIEKGDFLAVLGHNGAGKTLLLETLAGFFSVHRGRLYLRGKLANDMPPEMRGIGFLYQDLWLFPHLSVYDNISFGLKERGYSKDYINDRINELNELLGLSHLLRRNNVRLLSGGERQKVALARVLALNPDIIFLDEPSHSLDVENRERFYGVLRWLKSEGKTILYVLHQELEVLDMADYMLILKKGEQIDFRHT